MRRLVRGENDFETRYPRVAAEWHPTKNGDLKPSDVSYGTNRKVWWICKKGHEWEAAVAKRGPGGRGCPYCANKRVLAGYNDLASQYPEVALEWHPTKNGELAPSTVTWGSNRKVWWLCPKCGYEYQAVINKRTRSGESCPCCGPIAKRIKVGFNDLATTHPVIAVEWHPTKNGELTPEEVTQGSNKRVWWVCPTCKSDYDAVVAARVRGAACPYCAGKRVKAGYNDLATRYPEVAKEWHPTKNGEFTPSDVLPRSEKKYWWKCSRCGNEWKATPDSRINRMSCPECSFYAQTSFPEQAVLYYVKQAFPDAEGRSRKLGVELDIYIPSKSTAIEYDGVFYHAGGRAFGVADEQKDELCLENGIALYRVREPGLEPTPTATCIERTDLSNGDLDGCIVKLLSCLGTSVDVSVDRDQSAILAQYNTFIRDNSLQEVNPQLASEWHPTKNGGLLPENVPAGSGKKAWWLCPVCHGEWQTRIVERNQGTGCPYCANQKVLDGFNDLASRNPQMAAEWHPTKNGDLSPANVVSTSNRKVWWLCKTCGHEWQSSISSRARYNLGCPKCGAERGRVTQRKNRIKKGAPTFFETYPELATEWHPTKNGELKPSEITYHSGLEVWWKCPICGREWKQRIWDRARYNATGCSVCRRKVVSKQRTKGKEAYLAELAKIHPNVEIVGDYSNSNTKVKCRCHKCGYEWSVLPYSLLRQKYGCPNCSKTERGQSRRKDPEDFVKELNAINPNVEPLEAYSTSTRKILCRCLKCGNEWLVAPSKLLSGRGCPACSRNRASEKQKTTHEAFLTSLHEINPSIDVLGQYVNAKTPILCQCKRCGHKWNGTPTNLLRGTGCPKCARAKKAR